MGCEFCYQLDEGYFCSFHKEEMRTIEDIRKRVRQDFLDEYAYHPDLFTARLIVKGATPTQLRSFHFARNAWQVSRRFKYFIKQNSIEILLKKPRQEEQYFFLTHI